MAVALAAVLAFGMMPAVLYASESVSAAPVEVTVYVDGEAMELPAFDIGGRWHFDLRDIANALIGTDARFNVGRFEQTYLSAFDEDAGAMVNLLDEEGNYIPRDVFIIIEYGRDYASDVLELVTLRGIPTYRESFRLLIRPCTGEYTDDGRLMLGLGNVQYINGYVSNGVPLFQLWHLGMLLSFGVAWDSDAEAFLIDTSDERNFTPEVRDALIDFLAGFTSMFSFGVREYPSREFRTANWSSGGWRVGYGFTDWTLDLDAPPLAFFEWERDRDETDTFIRGIFDQSGNRITEPVFFQDDSIAVGFTLYDLDGDGIPEIFVEFRSFRNMLPVWSPLAHFTVMYRFVDGAFRPVGNIDDRNMFFIDNDGRLIFWQRTTLRQAGDMIHGFYEVILDGTQLDMELLVGFYHMTDPIQGGDGQDILDVVIRNHLTDEETHIGNSLSEWIADWTSQGVGNLPDRTLMGIFALGDLQQEIAHAVLQRLGIEH